MLQVMSELKTMAEQLNKLATEEDVKADFETTKVEPDAYALGVHTGAAEAFAKTSGIITKYVAMLEDRLPKIEEIEPDYEPDEEQLDLPF